MSSSGGRIPNRIPKPDAEPDVWPIGLFDEPETALTRALLRSRVGPPPELPAPPPQVRSITQPAARRRERRDALAMLPTDGLISAADLVDWLGLSRSTIHRLRSADDFPEPLQISRRRVAYRVADVREWLAAREQPQKARRYPKAA